MHRTPLRVTRTLLILTLIGALLGVLAGGVASAAPPPQPQDRVVSPIPAESTPNFADGAVKTILQVGSRMVAGGTFTAVTSHGSSTVLPRPFVAAFDANSGVVDPKFLPKVDGEVKAVLPGPTATSVFVGGDFTNVNGVRSKSLELVDVTTGASVPGFDVPPLDGIVTDLAMANGRLYVGGTFTVAAGLSHNGLLALNPTTGSVDASMSLQLAGHHNYQINGTGFAPVGVKKFAITPDGRRMVAVGNFTSISGSSRDQIAMIDLSGSTATIRADWATNLYTEACHAEVFDDYVRGVQFSPDGTYFVTVTTGGYGSPTSGCDGSARWDTAQTGSNVQPAWIAQTGGDSLYSVAVTGTAIYVGGHPRWQNNPYGDNYAESGAVPRAGIAALDPVNGLPLAWNAGRDRGHGAEALLATPTGLWVGSDTTYIGPSTYYRARVAYFPLAGGTVIPPPTTGTFPGTVKLAGPLSAGIYRDTISSRRYDGSTTGATTTSGGAIPWSQARGAVMINGTLYYGWSDGNLYKRSYDGTTFGPAELIDPYNDPVWSNVQTGSGQTYRGAKPSFYAQIPNVTGMFFSKGRLYYTLAGDPTLYFRYFTPDSGIVGAIEQVADTTLNWSDAGGMFIVDNRLYFVTRIDGKLHTVTFSNGRPTGAPTTVSGPSVDGNDWRSRALFLSTVRPK